MSNIKLIKCSKCLAHTHSSWGCMSCGHPRTDTLIFGKEYPFTIIQKPWWEPTSGHGKEYYSVLSEGGGMRFEGVLYSKDATKVTLQEVISLGTQQVGDDPQFKGVPRCSINIPFISFELNQNEVWGMRSKGSGRASSVAKSPKRLKDSPLQYPVLETVMQSPIRSPKLHVWGKPSAIDEFSIKDEMDTSKSQTNAVKTFGEPIAPEPKGTLNGTPTKNTSKNISKAIPKNIAKNIPKEMLSNPEKSLMKETQSKKPKQVSVKDVKAEEIKVVGSKRVKEANIADKVKQEKEKRREYERNIKETKRMQKEAARDAKQLKESMERKERSIEKAEAYHATGCELIGCVSSGLPIDQAMKKEFISKAIQNLSYAIREWPSECRVDIAGSCYERAQCYLLLEEQSKETIMLQVADLDTVLNVYSKDFSVMLQRIEAKYLLEDWIGLRSDTLSICNAVSAKVFTPTQDAYDRVQFLSRHADDMIQIEKKNTEAKLIAEKKKEKEEKEKQIKKAEKRQRQKERQKEKKQGQKAGAAAEAAESGGVLSPESVSSILPTSFAPVEFKGVTNKLQVAYWNTVYSKDFSVMLQRIEAKYLLEDWIGLRSDTLSICNAVSAKVFTPTQVTYDRVQYLSRHADNMIQIEKKNTEANLIAEKKKEKEEKEKKIKKAEKRQRQKERPLSPKKIVEDEKEGCIGKCLSQHQSTDRDVATRDTSNVTVSRNDRNGVGGGGVKVDGDGGTGHVTSTVPFINANSDGVKYSKSNLPSKAAAAAAEVQVPVPASEDSSQSATDKKSHMHPPLIGSRISLESLNDIRYEGFLYDINRADRTIALKDVRSFGTEDRVVDKSKIMPPIDSLYPYIKFHGDDIKNLHVHKTNDVTESHLKELSIESTGGDKSMLKTEKNRRKREKEKQRKKNQRDSATEKTESVVVAESEMVATGETHSEQNQEQEEITLSDESVFPRTMEENVGKVITNNTEVNLLEAGGSQDPKMISPVDDPSEPALSNKARKKKLQKEKKKLEKEAEKALKEKLSGGISEEVSEDWEHVEVGSLSSHIDDENDKDNKPPDEVEVKWTIDDSLKQSVDMFSGSPIRPATVNEMMSLRDPSKYAKFEEIEEDDIHIKEDDSESTSRTHDNERDDKEQTNSNTRVLSKSTVPVEASVDIDDSDDNTDFDLANFDSIFEDALWEIELTDSVVRWFKKNRKKNMKLCRSVVQRLETLANGYWCERNHKRLTGPKVDLYEANLSSGQRIIWEVAVNLSERLNSFDTVSAAETSTCSESDKVGSIHAEMIRVWAIVEDHDNLKREVKNVETCHQRGRDCLVQSDLVPATRMLLSNTNGKKDNDGVELRVPKTFSVKSVQTEVEIRPLHETDTSWVKQDRHYHLGSSNPNEYNLLKFYSFNSHMLGCLFAGNDRTDSSLPFKMTSKEYEVARLKPAKDCGILLMGRSGTGKTSVQCYRLAYDWVDYWKHVVNDEPLLRVATTTAVNFMQKMGNSEDLEDQGKKAEEVEEDEEMKFSHLRQVFVTKSMCLRTEVQRVARDLMRGSRVDGPISDINGVGELENFTNIPSSRYPLFTTLSEFMYFLDSTLEGGRFVSDISSNSRSTTELTGIGAYFDMDMDDEDDIEEGMDGLDRDASESPEFLDTSERERTVQQEMGWIQFLSKVWPKLPKKDKGGVDASLFWTEINSNLKGSVPALKVLAEFNSSSSLDLRMNALKEQYNASGKKQSAIPKNQRDQIWKLFVKYEQIRMQNHYFDQNDLVANLFRRLVEHGSKEVFFHRLYIDEVQDFTMAELFLLFQFCDPNFTFLAGDTAQTIARGIGFRFSDLKSLFNNMNDDMKGIREIRTPNPYSLVTSYRSHMGVLKLASSIIEVLYKYFPRAIDNLGLDRGLFEGPKPKLLLVDDIAELTVMLLGSQGNSSGRIDFGDEQVILVRDDEARKNVPPSLAESSIVLTVFEAKGLEFNTVLLWNFFKDSPATKEWRVLHSYWDNKRNNTNGDVEGEAGAGGTGEVHIESFESMEGSGKNRPLDFEEGKYTILEAELKALYCALTRARINIWIVDFDKEKRKPAFQWFVGAGLCEEITKHNSTTLSALKSGDQSSSISFQKRGLHFLSIAFDHEKPEGLLEAAATCFRLAEAEDLHEFVKARLSYYRAMVLCDNELSNKSKKRVSLSTENAMIEAAIQCLDCQGTMILPKLAARLLSKIKRHEHSAKIYSSLNSLSGSRKAAEEYEKANLPKKRSVELINVLTHIDEHMKALDSGSLDVSAEEPVQLKEKHIRQRAELSKLLRHYMSLAEKHFKSNRQYSESIALMERFNVIPPDDLLKLQLKSLIKRHSGKSQLLSEVIDDADGVQLPDILRDALNRIPVEGAVEMLLSDGGLDIAAVFLCEHNRKREAADILQRHFSYHKAAVMFKAIGEVRNTETCDVLSCLDALPVSTTCPPRQISPIYSTFISSESEPEKFELLLSSHMGRLKQAQQTFGKSALWLKFVAIGLHYLLAGDVTTLRELFLNKIKIFDMEKLSESPELAFVFDRWLLLNNPTSVLGDEVIKHILQYNIPSVIQLIQSMLNDKYVISEDFATYYGMDIARTGDPEVVELGKNYGSRVAFELCKEFEIELLPSLARTGNVRVNKRHVVTVLCAHLIRAVARFCMNIISQEKEVKSPLNTETIIDIDGSLIMKQISTIYSKFAENHEARFKNLLPDEDFAALKSAGEVPLKLIASAIFDVSANPWEVEKFLSSVITPKVAYAVCESVKTNWIDKFFSNRKQANSAHMVTTLWSSSVLANAIEKKVNNNRNSSCFDQYLKEANFKDKEWKLRRNSNYQYNGLAKGAKVIARTFIEKHTGEMSQRIYPEEIGFVVNGKHHDEVNVKFEQTIEHWCHVSKLIQPRTTTEELGNFIKCLHGELGDAMVVNSPQLLIRIIKHLSFEAIDEQLSASSAVGLTLESENKSLVCSANIGGKDGSSVNYFIELAVTLLLTMFAACSKPNGSKILIANHMYMKYIRDPLSRLGGSDDQKTTGNNDKKNKKKQKKNPNPGEQRMSKMYGNGKSSKVVNKKSVDANEQKSTFAVLKEMTQRCQQSEKVRISNLKELCLRIKGMIYFISSRLSCLKVKEDNEGVKQLSFLLLSLLANLPNYAHAFNSKDMVDKLYTKLVTTLIVDCGIGEAQEWQSTKEAVEMVCKLLEDDIGSNPSNVSDHNGFTSCFVGGGGGKKFTTLEIDIEDVMSELEDSEHTQIMSRRNVNDDTNNNNQFDRDEEESMAAYGGVENDIDAALQQRSELDLERDNKIGAALEVLSKHPAMKYAITKWRKRHDNQRKNNDGAYLKDINGEETMKSLQSELDGLLGTDIHTCKLCKVKMKGDSIEDHLTILPPLPPDPPTYEMAGKIMCDGVEVHFHGYTSMDRLTARVCCPTSRTEFLVESSRLLLELHSKNLEYYDAYLRYSQNEVVVALNEMRIRENEFEAARTENRWDDVDILKASLEKVKENYENQQKIADQIWNYAASCRYYNHLNSDQHQLAFEKMHHFRKHIEAPALKIVVKAIVLNRRVTTQIQKMITLDNNDGIKDELELKYSSVDVLIDEVKSFLTRCRTNKTFDSSNVLNMLKKSTNKLEEAVNDLEEIMKRATPQAIKTLHDVATSLGSLNMEPEYDDYEVDEMYDKADEADDNMTGTAGGFTPSKKELRKKNKNLKKMEKATTSEVTSPKGSSQQSKSRKKGSLASSKNKAK